MHKATIVGAGQIGDLITTLLANSGDYQVQLLDASAEQLSRLPEHARITKRVVDVQNSEQLKAALYGRDVVLSAAPFHLTAPIAKAAAYSGAHYLDLTEDVESTRLVRQLADNSAAAFVPQCGLAPGVVSILAADLIASFDELHTVKLKVGALPRYPSNSLSYNLTWSPEGVINEYCNPCQVVFDGQRLDAPPLEQIESLVIDGVEYESFNTSGGLGSLAETLDGKVNNLSYQSIRYPGHAAVMKTLLQDLGLSRRRDVLLDIFTHSLPTTSQDVVVIFISVSGLRHGKLEEQIYTRSLFGEEVAGRAFTAIQMTTASSACAVLDLLVNGQLPRSGWIRQEQIPLDKFLSNRFGRFFGERTQTTKLLAEVA